MNEPPQEHLVSHAVLEGVEAHFNALCTMGRKRGWCAIPTQVVNGNYIYGRLDDTTRSFSWKLSICQQKYSTYGMKLFGICEDIKHWFKEEPSPYFRTNGTLRFGHNRIRTGKFRVAFVISQSSQFYRWLWIFLLSLQLNITTKNCKPYFWPVTTRSGGENNKFPVHLFASISFKWFSNTLEWIATRRCGA